MIVFSYCMISNIDLAPRVKINFWSLEGFWQEQDISHDVFFRSDKKRWINYQSFYNVFSDFLIKWFARDYAPDTRQKSPLELMAGMKTVKKGAQFVLFS